MTRHIHFRAWFRRDRASHQEAESDGTRRGRRLHLERLENRSLLSGSAVADVTDGGTVDVDANYEVLFISPATADVVQSDVAFYTRPSDAANSVAEFSIDSIGGAINPITADDLPAKEPTTGLSGGSADALQPVGDDADSLVVSESSAGSTDALQAEADASGSLIARGSSGGSTDALQPIGDDADSLVVSGLSGGSTDALQPVGDAADSLVVTGSSGGSKDALQPVGDAADSLFATKWSGGSTDALQPVYKAAGTLTGGLHAARDRGMVDFDTRVVDSNSVTHGGLVDITPPSGESGALPDPFPEDATQVGSRLAKRPEPPSAVGSSAKPVAVEGAGGRSQAFELAMLTDSPVGRNDALPPADPHAPHGNRSATPVQPATTRLPGDRAVPSSNNTAPAQPASAKHPRHEVMSHHLTFEAADSMRFVSDTGSGTGEEQTDVALSHLSGQDSSPAELVQSDRSATSLANHTAQAPDALLDERRIVFTREEDWSHGDFDWLTVNLHNGRQTYAIAMVAAALVSLRSPGWYFPWHDERQTFLTPPPERGKSGS